MGRRPKAWGPARHGIIVIDKPLGVGSTQVVAKVRRAVQGNRTGHAGTLDPLATGVLVCCIGKATKAVEQIMAMTKVYQTTIDLTAFTETDDAEGERQVVTVDQVPDEQAVRQVLDALTGEIEQTPSKYSALKIDGRPAYELARAGRDVEMKSRVIRIDKIVIENFTWPSLTITVTCGRGTYIRSLARQIGTALGTGGYLTALRRLAVGSYTCEQAITLDDLPEELEESALLPVPVVDQG